MNENTNISKFINYCMYRKNLNDKTIKAYNTDLKQFYGFVGSNGLNKAEICNYIAHLNKSYKPKTCRRKIATLKAFVHYLIIEEIIDVNPFDRIDTSFREPAVLPKTIPINVIAGILEAAYTLRQEVVSDYAKKMCLRDIAVIETLFATGARVGEICSLTVDSLDISAFTVKIYGKGSSDLVNIP